MPRPLFQSTYSGSQVKSVLTPRLLGEIRVFLMYFVVTAIVITGVYTFVRFYAYTSVIVSGESMYPYHKTKDQIYIDLITPRFSTYRRGEVVVLQAPKECDDKDELFIKRIIGLPGETVSFQNGSVFISNPELTKGPVRLDEGSYLSREVRTYKIVGTNPNDPAGRERSEEKTLGQDEYYFMGDNRGASRDSRQCGPISKSKIVGREFYRSIPEDRRGYFKLPEYNLPND